MNRNICEPIIICGDVDIVIGIGINNTISISNTIKMIANRKNRIENGVRDV